MFKDMDEDNSDEVTWEEYNKAMENCSAEFHKWVSFPNCLIKVTQTLRFDSWPGTGAGNGLHVHY